MSSMKNVDVAWRLIDVVREWQKLKKMTSLLLLHPGFERGSIIGGRTFRKPPYFVPSKPQTVFFFF